MLRATAVLLRRVVLASPRVAAPLSRELRRRGAAPLAALRYYGAAKSESSTGGRASASRRAAVASADASQQDASDLDVDAAAAELRAQGDGEDWEAEEEEDDGEDESVWHVWTPRGRKELVVQGGVMLEPAVAERLKSGTNAKITSSEYISSAVNMEGCPPPKFPEFAFIGRSNVGKSSLINCLTSRKGLAMVSKTPGARRAQPPQRSLGLTRAPAAAPQARRRPSTTSRW